MQLSRCDTAQVSGWRSGADYHENSTAFTCLHHNIDSITNEVNYVSGNVYRSQYILQNPKARSHKNFWGL